ncbi:MAG: insulinase family protein [Planctomycetes bacterium]|nr:insulinase family protein [Planctomycetota bacterium]MBI3843226.1 insulinase family protein [Planctomycetota bacterium]
MRTGVIGAAVVAALVGIEANASEGTKGLMPYAIEKKTLPNGLDVIVIPMPEFKDVLSFNTLVIAGARNETTKGETGLAHLFEHILFTHRFGGKPGGYDEAIDRLGAHNNAFTSYDMTFYHPLTFTSNLVGKDGKPGLLELESARFKGLDFDEKIFKTETGAVLGEYRRGASNPDQIMDEKLLDIAFGDHPYGHTTIGYYADVLAMPNHYEAARRFYDTYYRPNNCAIIVSGDVKPAEIFAKVESFYGDWKRQDVPPIDAAAPPEKSASTHVDWDSDVAPRVEIGYRVPKHVSTSIDTAVGQIAPELLFSETAPLYQMLRYQKKSASDVEFDGRSQYESMDSRLFSVTATLFKDRFEKEGKSYLDEVTNDLAAGMEGLRLFSSRPDAAATLEILKKKYKYDFQARLSSPADVAVIFARYYRFERDPNVLDVLLRAVEALKPTDIDAYATTYFKDSNRFVVTLTGSAAKGGAR